MSRAVIRGRPLPRSYSAWEKQKERSPDTQSAPHLFPLLDPTSLHVRSGRARCPPSLPFVLHRLTGARRRGASLLSIGETPCPLRPSTTSRSTSLNSSSLAPPSPAPSRRRRTRRPTSSSSH